MNRTFPWNDKMLSVQVFSIDISTEIGIKQIFGKKFKSNLLKTQFYKWKALKNKNFFQKSTICLHLKFIKFQTPFLVIDLVRWNILQLIVKNHIQLNFLIPELFNFWDIAFFTALYKKLIKNSWSSHKLVIILILNYYNFFFILSYSILSCSQLLTENWEY